MPNPGGGSAVTWAVDANVTDPALADNMMNMFYGMFTGIFNGVFAETTTTTQANPYTFKLTEVIAGGEPDAVFDFYAGSWVGPELE